MKCDVWSVLPASSVCASPAVWSSVGLPETFLKLTLRRVVAIFATFVLSHRRHVSKRFENDMFNLCYEEIWFCRPFWCASQALKERIPCLCQMTNDTSGSKKTIFYWFDTVALGNYLELIFFWHVVSSVVYSLAFDPLCFSSLTPQTWLRKGVLHFLCCILYIFFVQVLTPFFLRNFKFWMLTGSMNKDFKTQKWVVSLRCDARQLPNFENQRRE